MTFLFIYFKIIAATLRRFKMETLERWRITVGELGQQFDLDFSNGRIVNMVCAGVHRLCNGFVDYREVSATHYVLACGGCGLSIPIPKEVQTKAQILDFFIQKGFHKKGEEVRVCLKCEGKGQIRQTEFKEEKDWTAGNFKTAVKEIRTTINCPECAGKGLL